MTGTFTAKVRAAIRKNERVMTAVFKQSVQDTIRTAQKTVKQGGNMPVDTGFLRNSSAVAGLNGSTMLTGAGDTYVLVIAQATIDDTITFGWTAEYARPVEYGSRGRTGRFFMREAAAQWQEIVRRNAAAVRLT